MHICNIYAHICNTYVYACFYIHTYVCVNMYYIHVIHISNPKLGRFYLLPKIHKRLHDIPGRPVISNSSYYTEKISSFIEYHLKPLAQKVKSYIKDTNDFLRKLSNLPSLPEDVILYTIDVVGLYPNIQHEGGLAAIKEALDKRDGKSISTETLM